VGRPNVGKSTLFNRLTGSRKALVEDTPGVTRDRNYGDADWFGKRFVVIDTGGFDPDATEGMLPLMREQATLAIEEADFIVFVMNAREGLNPADQEIASILRQTDKPVFHVANKVEGLAVETQAAELYAIGAEHIHMLSAEHGTGLYDLLEEMTELMPAQEPEPEIVPDVVADEPSAWDEEEDGDEPHPEPHVASPEEVAAARVAKERTLVAVVGKPNVGKSSLINRLLGAPRLLASDVPGTTRDSIDTELDFEGRKYLLIDTAGIRRKKAISLRLEKFSIVKALQSIERCHVAVLVIDGTQGVTDQDAKIASTIVEKGRAAVIVVNKWDLVEKDDATAGAFVHQLWEKMPFFQFAPVIFTSALTGQRVTRALELVDKARRSALYRIPTGPLNRFFDGVVKRHPPPLHKNHNVKLYYLRQVGIAPPTIVAACNTPQAIAPSYERYMVNQLRLAFDFEGTPIRLFFRGRSKKRGAS
jgi:GTP-binding protein